MDIKSTTRTIVETTHVVTMDKADQDALRAVAARNKLGAAPDAPATITEGEDGSVSVKVIVTTEVPKSDVTATPQPGTQQTII